MTYQPRLEKRRLLPISLRPKRAVLLRFASDEGTWLAGYTPVRKGDNVPEKAQTQL